MIANTARTLRENVQKVIVGKDDAINLALVAVLCEGHILLEDVPGIGKTTLARALASSIRTENPARFGRRRAGPASTRAIASATSSRKTRWSR